MPNGNFTQSNFQGGQWSARFQGRTDHPKYRTAMNVCLNGFPTEEGAWTRRSGFNFAATTYKGQQAKIITFDFKDAMPYTLEFTNNALRMFNGSQLVKTNDPNVVAAISADAPAVVTLVTPMKWATGDQVEFLFLDQVANPYCAILTNRQFDITVIDTTHFTMADPITGEAVNGADIAWRPGNRITCARVLRFDTEWTNDLLEGLRSVQLETTALILSPGHAPMRLDAVAPPPTITVTPQTASGTSPAGPVQMAGVAVTSVIDSVGNSEVIFNMAENTAVLGWAQGDLFQILGYPEASGSTAVQTFPGIWVLDSRSMAAAGSPDSIMLHNQADGSQPKISAIGIVTFVVTAIAPVSASAPAVTPPQNLTVQQSPAAAPDYAEFELSQATFTDGPYMDYPTQSQLTPSTTGLGQIQFTVAFQAWSSTATYNQGDRVTYETFDFISLVDLNTDQTPPIDGSSNAYWKLLGQGAAFGPLGVQSTDVGRHVRVFSTPQVWNKATTYSSGDAVLYNGVPYVCGGADKVSASTPGLTPDVDYNEWTITLTAVCWVWGIITSVQALNQFTAQMMAVPDAAANNDPNSGILYSSPCLVWMLGVYSDTTGWPTGGCYHQGRIWLFGAQLSRLDASISGVYPGPGLVQAYSFQPTAQDGTVSDANGMSWLFDADSTNTLLWAQPGPTGLLVGTKAGEWLVQASQLADPITPTSIQANRVTRYGSSSVLPVRVPLAIVFVQKYLKKAMEFLKDVFTGHYSAPNLSQTAEDLAAPGIAEIGYNEEPTPIIWQRDAAGGLAGCTYRRVSAFTTEDPAFVGWHMHTMGSGRLVERMVIGGADNSGTSQTVHLVTNDYKTNLRFFEVQHAPFNENDTLSDACFLDCSVQPSQASVWVDADGKSWMRFFGLWHLNGKTATVFAAEQDCGDWPVTNGYCDVPLDQPGQPLTRAQLTALTQQNIGNEVVVADDVIGGSYTAPVQGPTIYGFDGALQNIVGGIGATGDAMVCDWNSSPPIAFVEKSGALTTSQGLYTFNLQTGAFIQDKNILQILANVTVPDGFSTTGLFDIDDTYIYLVSFTGFARVPRATLVADKILSGYTSDNAYGCCAFQANGNHYLAIADNTQSHVRIFNTDSMTLVFTGTFSEHFLNMSNGARFNKAGDGVMLGVGTWDSFAPSSVNIYRWDVQSDAEIQQKTLCSFTAGEIDPTWTGFGANNGPGALICDPTDGNAIFCVTGPLGATVGAYMIKLNVQDGTVMWKTPINADPGFNPTSCNIAPAGTPIPAGQSGGMVVVNGEYTAAAQPKPGNAAATRGFSYRWCRIALGNLGTSTSVLSWLDNTAGGIVCLDFDTGKIIKTVPLTTTIKVGQGQGCGVMGYTASAAGQLYGVGGSGLSPRYWFPAWVGLCFNSDGQVVRPALNTEILSPSGPGLAKSRRSQMFGALLDSCIRYSIAFGTDFSHLRPANFTTKGGTPIPAGQLFSGVHWDTLDDTDSFDGGICWRITRPWPATVCQVGQFIEGEDRA